MLRNFAASLAFSAMALCAAETRVLLKDLPVAVQQTVKEQTQNAKVRGFSKEVEKGDTFYEAETVTASGQTRDILIDVSGKVVEVEQEVSLNTVGLPVQKALKSAAGSGKILKVESVTKGDTVSYEAVVQKGGKKTEVAVNADGTPKKE